MKQDGKNGGKRGIGYGLIEVKSGQCPKFFETS